MRLTAGSLFSGIGGLDLGLERAGMTVIWQSEIDPYASRVLAKHWPHVPNLGDITAVDWSTVERPDLICGGYPCQPFSLAGVRRGEGDPRHLWPHFHRAIRHLRPRYALLENVPGHLSLGFDRVLGDLAEIGYDAEWCSVPAAAVGAPHLRWRIFAVAYPQRDGLRQQPVAIFGGSGPAIAGDDGEARTLADADGQRLQERRQPHRPSIADLESSRWDHTRRRGEDVADADRQAGRQAGAAQRGARRRAGQWPSTQPGGRGGGQDGTGHWATEPDVGRVAHGVPARVDRLRCLGNAVVPQVAEHIGRRLIAALAGGGS